MAQLHGAVHIHDPDYIGPGCWVTLHLAAAKAETPADKQGVLYIIHLFKKYFVCEDCRLHFSVHVRADPPERYLEDPEGLFYRTHVAHNNANDITGKARMSYAVA